MAVRQRHAAAPSRDDVRNQDKSLDSKGDIAHADAAAVESIAAEAVAVAKIVGAVRSAGTTAAAAADSFAGSCCFRCYAADDDSQSES